MVQQRKTKTGLSETELAGVLERGRAAVAGQSKKEALPRVREFIQSILHVSNGAAGNVSDGPSAADLQVTVEEYERYLKDLLRKSEEDRDELLSLRYLSYDRKHFVRQFVPSRKVAPTASPRLQEVHDEIGRAIDELEWRTCENAVRRASSRVLHNAVSAEGVIRVLQLARECYRQIGHHDEEAESKIRMGLARASWYRAKERLEKAATARAGGRTRVADSLAGEARVMLRQDWRRAFPGEEPPQLPEV